MKERGKEGEKRKGRKRREKERTGAKERIYL